MLPPSLHGTIQCIKQGTVNVLGTKDNANNALYINVYMFLKVPITMGHGNPQGNGKHEKEV